MFSKTCKIRSMPKQVVCYVNNFDKGILWSLLPGDLEKLKMPAVVISVRRWSFKLVQNESMKMEALHSTIIHDKYKIHLHICNNMNFIYYIF